MSILKVRINGFDVEGTSGEIRELIGMAPAATVEGDVKKAQTFELQSRMAGMSMQDTISMLVNLLGADNKLQGSMPVNNTVVPEVIPSPQVATEPTPVVMPNGDVLNLKGVRLASRDNIAPGDGTGPKGTQGSTGVSSKGTVLAGMDPVELVQLAERNKMEYTAPDRSRGVRRR